MTATTDVTAARYTDGLIAALRLFDGCRGTVVIDARSLHGFGQQGAHVTPPFEQGVPLPVLQLLLDGFSLRIAPATRSGQALAELPFAWALWRPATRFDRSTGHRHAVEPDAAAAIAATLAGMPPASLVIDAAHEVVAAWRLEHPVNLTRDADQARDLQTELAQRLHADADVARDLAAFLPLGGVVRNWNVARPDHIQIVTVLPERRYDVEQLLKPPTGGEHP